ncbi:TonB-dependent receptor [Ascidiimonas aurantiaca]|uniref:TonB-dependent receptor n=1 Tax=Ascidiimonas aurantiaca TaxID=1685432 RepID=UPI0030ED06D1
MQNFQFSFLHYSLFFLFACVHNLCSAQEINGYVRNGEGQPIEAATVRAYPGGKYAITDRNGYFRFSGRDANAFRLLEVSHVAYLTERVELSALKELSALEIRMTDAVTDLEEVTVVQTRILQEVINNSQSVVSIDQDFISKNSTGTFSGALAALPGVNTMNVGVGIAKPMIRGMGFNRILVNDRGIKREGQQWGSDHGLEVDPFDVEQVDIIKGPATLLFGSDGLGGVINIKENESLPENGNVLHYSTGYQTNNGAISNSIEWKSRKDQWFFSTRITHQDYGDYTVPSDEFTYAGFNLPIFDNRLKNTAGNEIHFSGVAGYKTQNIKTSIRFSSFNQKAGIFTGAIGLPRVYNLQHNGEFRDIDIPRQENHHHMVTSNTTLSIGSDRLEVDLGYQHNIREELSFPGAHGVSPDQANGNLALGLYLDTYTANMRYEINPDSDRQFLFGAQLQYMNNERDGFEFLLPNFNSFQYGFFHYQLWNLSTKWTVNGGIRYDLGSHDIQRHLQPVYDRGTLQPTGDFTERTPEFDRQFSNFSGALGTTYRLNARNLFKLNLGNSFRFPTAIELSSNGVHHGNFRHELGDPDLKMERGYQADVTYVHQSNNFFLEIAAFYGYYNNYIYLAPTGNFSFLASGGTLWQYRQNDAVFNGFEIMSSYRFAFGLKADLAADFVQNLNQDTRLPLPLTPQPSTSINLEYNLLPLSTVFRDSYIFVLGRYNFAQNRTDRNERDTPSSFLLNAGFGFDIKLFGQTTRFRVSANNLLNTAYFNHISRYRLLNLPEQGRNIVFSASVPIHF